MCIPACVIACGSKDVETAGIDVPAEQGEEDGDASAPQQTDEGDHTQSDSGDSATDEESSDGEDTEEDTEKEDEGTDDEDPDDVDPDAPIDVEQMLADRCGGCHNEDAETAELDLNSPNVVDRVSGVASAGCEGFTLANPQDPTGSLLYLKVSSEDSGCGEMMPPAPFEPLSDEELRALRDWIAGLAPPAPETECTPREERICEGVGNSNWWPDLNATGAELSAEMTKICTPPMQTCSADGTEWGPCEGITPQVEDCTTPEDEDCNLATPANECQDAAWAFSVTGELGMWLDSVDVDGEGNVIAFGTFAGETDFGGGMLATDVPGGQYKNDVALAKYDRFGTHVWSKNFGDTSNQYATRVAVDKETGDIAIVMRLFGSIDFGPGSPTYTQNGSSDFIVVLFDSDGNYRWSQHFGGNALDRAERIAFTRDNGDVIVAGKAGFDEDEQLTVPGQGAISPRGQADALIVRLGRAVGDVKWYHLAGGRDLVFGDTEVEGVGDSCDAGDGEQYRRCKGCGAQHCVPDSEGSDTGTWSEECAPLRDDSEQLLFGCERADLLCAEDAQFSATCRSGDDDYAWGLDTDADGDVYVTGRFEGYFEFPEGEAESRGAHDIFVLKLNGGTGTPEWARHFGGQGDDRAYDLALQPGTGNILVTGFFTGAMEVSGPGATESAMVQAAGGETDDDILLVSLDPSDGSTVFANAYGDEASQFGISHELAKTTRNMTLAVDLEDNVYIGGFLYGAFHERLAANTGSDPKPDLFYAKLSPEGEYQNGRVHGGTGSELAYDMALDPVTDSVILSGRFYSSSMNLGAAGTILGISNISSMFVAKWPQP